MTTFNPRTGSLLREARLKDAIGDYYASPVAGDGKIYFVSKDGKATVIRKGADWEILAVNDLEDDTFATPAIFDNKLYLRTRGMLYCFSDQTDR